MSSDDTTGIEWNLVMPSSASGVDLVGQGIANMITLPHSISHWPDLSIAAIACRVVLAQFNGGGDHSLSRSVLMSLRTILAYRGGVHCQ